MTSDAYALPATSRQTARRLSFPSQVYMLTKRNLVTIFRTPEALIPPIAISIFFLVIYQSTLGRAAGFIPNLGGDYLGFILPLSIVSASLSGAGIAAQNLVRDNERGYFDKLLLTPVNRAVLLLSPILAGALILGLQAAIVVGVAMLLGLDPATGWLGLLAVIGLAVLLGTGFAGFTVSAALGSGNAAATQSAGFVFFPLIFLAPTFVPLELLDGWLNTAAKLNPITYVLGSMRTLINNGVIAHIGTGHVVAQNQSRLENTANGILVLSSDSKWRDGGGTASTFINAGTVYQTSGKTTTFHFNNIQDTGTYIAEDTWLEDPEHGWIFITGFNGYGYFVYDWAVSAWAWYPFHHYPHMYYFGFVDSWTWHVAGTATPDRWFYYFEDEPGWLFEDDMRP